MRPSLQDYSLALLRTSRTWRRLADRSAKAFGLSEATAFPLTFIQRLGDGLRQSALAEAIGIEAPSLVPQLDQLCAAGLVERREDPTDKRAKTVHLTTDGRRLVAALRADLDQAREAIFADVSTEDLAASLRVFAAIQRAADHKEAAE